MENGPAHQTDGVGISETATHDHAKGRPRSASTTVALGVLGGVLTGAAVGYLLVAGIHRDPTVPAVASPVVTGESSKQLASVFDWPELVPSSDTPVTISSEDPGAADGSSPAGPSGSAAAKEARATDPAAGRQVGTGPTEVASRLATPNAAEPVKGIAGKGNAAPATIPSWGTAVIRSTAVLFPGENWQTNRIRLTLRADGNLVLTDETNRATWATNTSDAHAQVTFQGDGNLTLTDTVSGTTLWSSRTEGHGSAVLVLQADGNVVIQDGSAVLWAALR